jgi:hypothetical protein
MMADYFRYWVRGKWLRAKGTGLRAKIVTFVTISMFVIDAGFSAC